MKQSFAIIIFMILLAACITTTPTARTEPINVQYTAGSIPWLPELYTCAGANIITAEQRAADLLDPPSGDLAFRIGQPEELTSLAYQIGSEDLLVIVNPQNPVNSLTVEQTIGLFSGQIMNWQEVGGSDAPVQVWVFASGEDVQQILVQTILGGRPVASKARLATGPDEMVKAIADDTNAVGILTRSWKTGNVSEVYTVATVPVLAIAMDNPTGVVRELLACLQK